MQIKRVINSANTTLVVIDVKVFLKGEWVDSRER